MTGTECLPAVSSHDEYSHRILTAIGEGRPVSQRLLSRELGVALGLTNLLVRRLVKKGYVKVTTIPRNRVRYLITPAGLAEKTRLTYQFMNYSLRLYRQARQQLRVALHHENGMPPPRVAIFGTGEAAEIAYLGLKEQGLEPVAVFTIEGGGTFLGMPVGALDAAAHEVCDRLILATLDRPELVVEQVVQVGVPREKVLTLKPLRSVPANNNQ